MYGTCIGIDQCFWFINDDCVFIKKKIKKSKNISRVYLNFGMFWYNTLILLEKPVISDQNYNVKKRNECKLHLAKSG